MIYTGAWGNEDSASLGRTVFSYPAASTAGKGLGHSLHGPQSQNPGQGLHRADAQSVDADERKDSVIANKRER